LLECAGLLGPSLDLALALNQNLGELGAPALHVGDAAVEDFNLLTALGELEAGLRERVALHVALGAQGGDRGLDFVGARATGFDRLLGLDELLAGAVKTRLHLMAGRFELLEFAIHAFDALDELLDRALAVALLLLDGGKGLRGFKNLAAFSFEVLLSLGETELNGINELALRIMSDLVVGEGLGRLA